MKVLLLCLVKFVLRTAEVYSFQMIFHLIIKPDSIDSRKAAIFRYKNKNRQLLPVSVMRNRKLRKRLLLYPINVSKTLKQITRNGRLITGRATTTSFSNLSVKAGIYEQEQRTGSG